MGEEEELRQRQGRTRDCLLYKWSVLKICCYKCGQKLDLSELAPFEKINCPVCQVTIIVPKPFGSMLLEENLGEGTMATVYRAMDITLDREVAVKVLNTEWFNSEIGRSFINEARSASAVNHPNVIPIYSCGEMEGQIYITMQYMEGGSLLRQAESSERPTGRSICKWIAETARGLDSAAIHGVEHHNIKPANVFLDADGNVKVGDFGIGQIIDEGDPLFDNNKVSPRVTLEMSYYLSPEKISTGKEDIAGDIYSLGATMYHVVCGQPPFNSRDVNENIRARFEGPPPEPKTLHPELDDELNQLLQKMLSIYPSERPRSYSDLSRKLDGIRRRLKNERPDDGTDIDIGRTLREDHQQPLVRADASPKAGRVITISGNGQDDYDEEDEVGLMHTLLRLIPLVVIALAILLVIAHKKNWPIYNDTIRPMIEKLIGEPAGEPVDEEVPETID